MTTTEPTCGCQEFLDPRILSCGHTSCKSCIKRKGENELVCPACEHVTHAELDNLPVNCSITPGNDDDKQPPAETIAAITEESTVSPSTILQPEDDEYKFHFQTIEQTLKNGTLREFTNNHGLITKQSLVNGYASIIFRNCGGTTGIYFTS
jgi:hypothetical protein